MFGPLSWPKSDSPFFSDMIGNMNMIHDEMEHHGILLLHFIFKTEPFELQSCETNFKKAP